MLLPAIRRPNFLIAVGEQRSQGIELDIVGKILGWNIIAFTHNDAEITEDMTSGNRLYNAPEHSASLWTTYESNAVIYRV